MKETKNWEVQGMKGNKELGSPRNEGNKTAKNEINEVFDEEDEEQHNKSLCF